MRILIYLGLVVFFVSCRTNKNASTKKNYCVYTLTDLFNNYDSTKFNIDRKFIGQTDIMDSSKELSGDYTFDANGTLRVYQFVKNRESCNFRVDFDTTGYQMDSLKTPVVKWFTVWQGKKKDSIVAGCVLYHINYAYDSIQLKYLNYCKNIQLGNSDFLSNMVICHDTALNPHQRMKLYVTGIMQDKCTMKIKYFADSSLFFNP